MDKSAIISECQKFRYVLRRIWSDAPQVCFIMLNPSTANSFEDDPTIRRCISFAKSWGYGGIRVLNLFAYRATNPKELLAAEDPIGERNEMYLKIYTDGCEKIICAWGNYGIVKKLFEKYPSYMPFIAKELHCLGRNAKGDPKHPLYLKGDLIPVNYLITTLNS